MEKENNGAAEKKRRNIRRLIDSQPKLVGKPEDIVPFAWRYPLDISGIKKLSKPLKTLLQQEQTGKYQQ